MMNSRSCSSFLAALVLLVAMVVSTNASASALRKLRPKPKVEAAVALGVEKASTEETCGDDLTYQHSGDPQKTCSWLAGLPDKKKAKKCKKKHFKKHCKETCDRCGSKKCPNKVDSNKFQNKSCDGYKDGLKCNYDYKVIGCESDGSDFRCLPGTSWKCEDGVWVKENLYTIQCIPEPFNPGHGKVCDPETYEAPEPDDFDEDEDEDDEDDVGSETPVVCPDFVPTAGDDCTRTGLTTPDGCPYNFVATGCTENTLACLPINTFHCQDNGDGMIWQHEILSVEDCGDDMPDNWPSGSCDPSVPLVPPVSGEPEGDYCPDHPPPPDLPCTRVGEQAANPDGCEYNHIVTGCTYDDLHCSPIEWAYCEGLEPEQSCEGDNCIWIEHTYWAVSSAGVEFCDNQPRGSPWGYSCDPDTFAREDYLDVYTTDSEPPEDKPYACPAEEPTYTDHCNTDDIIPPNGCEYRHVVMGCTEAELSCVPIIQATCEEADEPYCDTRGNCYDGLWSILSMSIEECTNQARDWPAGEYCDPDRFDASDYLSR